MIREISPEPMENPGHKAACASLECQTPRRMRLCLLGRKAEICRWEKLGHYAGLTGKRWLAVVKHLVMRGWEKDIVGYRCQSTHFGTFTESLVSPWTV